MKRGADPGIGVGVGGDAGSSPAAGGNARRGAARWARRLRAAALLAAGLALASVLPARAGTVAITDNQDLGSVARLNNRGEVVWAERVDGIARIYLWDGATRHLISDPTVFSSWPWINDTGQVAWMGGNRTLEIYLWDGSTIRQLTDNPPPNGVQPEQSTYPQINNAGQVAWLHGGNYTDLFLWNGLGAEQLTPDDGGGIAGWHLNGTGQVVWCVASGSPQVDSIYLWNGSSVRLLARQRGVFVDPQINDAGQVAWWGSDGSTQHLYFWDGAALRTLPTPTPMGTRVRINAAGQVIWESQEEVPGGDALALYLWDGSSVQRLTQAAYDVGIPPTNTLAAEINDRGQIVWNAWNGHYRQIYLWDGGRTQAISPSAVDASFPLLNNAGQVLWQSQGSTPMLIDDNRPIHLYLYTPASPGSLELSAGSVTGGHPVTATVTLAAPAPAGGLQLVLTSDNPAATVPPTLSVPAGQTTAAFTVTTSPVAAPAAVTLTAAADSFTATAALALSPPALADLSLDLVSLIGGAPTFGTVTLADPAPAGGLPLALASADPAATVPAQVTVPAGQTTAAFTITTTPVAARTPVAIRVAAGSGARSATMTLLPSVVAAAPALSLQPESLAFGDQPVGHASPAQTLTLTNSGAAPLVIQASHLEGDNAADFSLPDLAGTTVAPGENHAITVSFTPGGQGSRSATLVITDTAPGSPHRLPLSGGGLAPVVRFSPGTLAFGAEPVGLTGTLGLLVQNTGDTSLTVRGITFQGANAGDFSLATDGVTGQSLQPGEIALLNIHFSPTATGSRSATLVLADDAPDSPQSLALTGVGTAPLLRLSADSLLFGLQSSSTQTLTLTNNGDAPLNIQAVTLGGPDAGHFKIVSDTGEASLPVGGSRTVQIAFQSATVAGAPRHGTARVAAVGYSATLEIKDNDPHPTSRHSVALIASSSTGASGSSTPPPPPAAPGNLTATVAAGPQVQLTWSNPQPDPHASVTVWRQEGTGNWTRVALLPGDATSFTDNNVSVNASYTYQAHWVNGPVVSPWSNLAHASTAGVTLAPPSGLTATVGSGPQVRLSWSLPAPNSHAYLTIWRQAGSGEWTRVALLRGDATHFTDTSVQAETSYTYHAHLVTDAAVSAWSNTATVSTPTAGPAQLTAVAGPGARVVLTWHNPHPDAHAWLTVWRQAGSGAWTRVALLHGDAAGFTDTQVTAGSSYRYRAHRVEGADVSDWSNEAAVALP